MCLEWYFSLKMSLHLNSEVFLAKIREILKLEKVREHDEETEYFEKKTAFIILKDIFNNVGGRKISRR